MNCSIRAVTAVALALSAFALGTPEARAAILHSQPSTYPSGAFYYSTTGIGAVVYDNFTLGADSTITQVDWVGAYFTPGSVSEFTISFWTNDATVTDQPGTLISQQTIAGNAGQTFIGSDSGGFGTYSYSTPLTTSFSADAGITYWMSIVATTSDPWAWYTGTGGDGLGYDDFPGLGRIAIPDLAYTLVGTNAVVPEPTSMALAGFAGIGMAVGAWRRRRQQAA